MRALPLPATSTQADFTTVLLNPDGSQVAAVAVPTTASRIPSSEANTNPTSAKATAGSLFHVNGYNSSATITYLKFYDKATAPTVGTDTPVLTLALPALAVFSYDLQGFVFATGIAYGLTTAAADNGTAAPAAAAVLGLNVVMA